MSKDNVTLDTHIAITWSMTLVYIFYAICIVSMCIGAYYYTNSATVSVIEMTQNDAVKEELAQLYIVVFVSMIFFFILAEFIFVYVQRIFIRRKIQLQKKFIHKLTHELRTPLAVMLTSNEVALYSIAETGPVRSVIETNIEEIKYISNILTTLITSNPLHNDA